MSNMINDSDSNINGYIHHSVQSGFIPKHFDAATVAKVISHQDYLNPQTRELTRQLSLPPEQWSSMVPSSLGAELAITNGLEPEKLDLHKVLSNKDGMEWLIHRYPKALPEDMQPEIAKQLIKTKANLLIESALKRPDWSPEVRSQLLQSIKSENDVPAYVHPWMTESLYDPTYRKGNK